MLLNLILYQFDLLFCSCLVCRMFIVLVLLSTLLHQWLLLQHTWFQNLPSSQWPQVPTAAHFQQRVLCALLLFYYSKPSFHVFAKVGDWVIFLHLYWVQVQHQQNKGSNCSVNVNVWICGMLLLIYPIMLSFETHTRSLGSKCTAQWR